MKFGNLYLGNKMMGIPFFNAPWFYAVAYELRQVDGVTSVFNPAEKDAEMGFNPMGCPKGSAEEAKAGGFDRRKTLRTDWHWIASRSDGLVVGPDWQSSTGTISEIACHQALGLPVWEYEEFSLFVGKGRPDLLELRQHRLPSLAELLGV